MRFLLPIGLAAAGLSLAAPLRAQDGPQPPPTLAPLLAPSASPSAPALAPAPEAVPDHVAAALPEPRRSTPPAQTPAGPPPLSLEQAIDRALAHSPAIAAAVQERRAADGALMQAGARPNPVLNTTVEDTRRATRTTTATFDFPVELGAKRSARISAAERNLAAADARLMQVRAEVRAKVLAAYTALLVAQERASLADAAQALSQRALAAVRRRVAAGKVAPLEQSRAAVDDANAALERAEAQAEGITARQALAAAMGDEQPIFGAVAADLSAAPQRPGFTDLANQLPLAPALLWRRAEAQHRRAQVEVARSAATPDLTLSVGAKRENDTGRTQAVVGLSLPLALFDRQQGSLEEARRRADQADDEARDQQLALLAELQDACSRLAVATTSLRVLREVVVPAAEEAHRVATTGFDAGKFGFLEVLDTQRTLLQARARALDTWSAAWQAAAAVDRIVGH